jgi:hypothetical protein
MRGVYKWSHEVIRTTKQEAVCEGIMVSISDGVDTLVPIFGYFSCS